MDNIGDYWYVRSTSALGETGIDCCASVDFDLDYGPKITSVYPPLELTASEEGNM